MIVSIWRESGAEKYRYRCRGGNIERRNVGMRTLEATVRIVVCCLAARVGKSPDARTEFGSCIRQGEDGGLSRIDLPPARMSRIYRPRWKMDLEHCLAQIRVTMERVATMLKKM
ncbi:hypothetical protein K439DRAFT_545064 [Ramaria rubella]|nr:hypothetical protein K439DRAFT_545064 [Ramaria rubella]